MIHCYKINPIMHNWEKDLKLNSFPTWWSTWSALLRMILTLSSYPWMASIDLRNSSEMSNLLASNKRMILNKSLYYCAGLGSNPTMDKKCDQIGRIFFSWAIYLKEFIFSWSILWAKFYLLWANFLKLAYYWAKFLEDLGKKIQTIWSHCSFLSFSCKKANSSKLRAQVVLHN